MDFATLGSGFPEFGEESALFRGIFEFGERVILVAELPDFPFATGNLFVDESGTFKFPDRDL